MAQYDVVIVGSGIAGAILAKTLTQAGKSVLLLEAGLKAGIALNPEDAYNTYQDYLRTFYETDAKVPNAPYPDIRNAPSSDVLEIQAQTPYSKDSYLVQLGPLPFASDNMRGPGGTTLHWLGNTPRMLPNDFKMKTNYGQGVDWPISYHDLVPYYEMAENEIGISGDVGALVGPDMDPVRDYGPDYVFPMHKIPQSYMDQVWMSRLTDPTVTMDGKDYTVTNISMPQGRNSIPNKEYKYVGVKWTGKKLQLETRKSDTDIYRPVGAIWDDDTGQRCEGNASCVPICPVQAKYNALKTLNKADRRLLDIRTQAVATKVLLSEDGKTVTGIEYKTYQRANSTGYTTSIATGKQYVLAASAIENAKILLASDAANRSDQVGRNLMDHLVMLTWGLMKDEAVYPYRGPGCTTYIPTFRDGEFRKDFAAWISPVDNWGWSWPTFAPGTDVNEFVQKDGLFGKELREALKDRISRQILLHFECEQAPDPANRVVINENYKDHLDNYRPVIYYDASEYMRKSFEKAREVSKQIFEAIGVEDYTDYKPTDPDYVTYNGQGYTFWGAGHIVGTHRMGDDPTESVVDENQRSHDHENLYVVGCGSMPTLGTSNPTLTMSALTYKTAEAILRTL